MLQHCGLTSFPPHLPEAELKHEQISQCPTNTSHGVEHPLPEDSQDSEAFAIPQEVALQRHWEVQTPPE